MADLPPTYVLGFHNESEVRKMKYNNFGATGLKVSHLSIGTGGFCLQYGDYTIAECKAALEKAIKSGINYIDTAPWYGHGVSEEVLGKCLEGIPRQAYYMATKVGRYEADPKLMFDFSADKTRWSIDTSLRKLGLDCIDIIQVHDIEFASSLDVVLNETLPVLEEVRRTGKVKYIGVTGYPVATLDQCIRSSGTKIDAVLSYTRLSLLDRTLNQYLPYFQSKHLGIVNAAGHCMGLLTDGGPQPWHPAPKEIKDVCREANEYCKLKGVELAKLAIHYCFQQPGPHTHLVGMNTCKLVQANLDVLHNGLSELEEQVLNHLQDKIFTKLTKGTWEAIEIEQYKRNLFHQ